MSSYILFENGYKISVDKKFKENVIGKVLFKNNLLKLIDINTNQTLSFNIKNFKIPNSNLAKYVNDSLSEEFHIYDLKTTL